MNEFKQKTIEEEYDLIKKSNFGDILNYLKPLIEKAVKRTGFDNYKKNKIFSLFYLVYI